MARLAAIFNHIRRMKVSLFQALTVGLGLATITMGLTPVMAETSTSMPNWNDQISGLKLGANVRVIAYEHGQFQGASVILNGSGIEPESTGQFSNLAKHSADGSNWSNRISSLKVIDGRTGDTGTASDDSLHVFFYQNADFGGAKFSLKAGAEIADLAEWKGQPDQVAMTVHEWGTFTVLQGSDGGPIKWYQAPKDIVDLPAFVGMASIFSKGGYYGDLELVRMETPVLYFYPQSDEAIEITVSASLQGGRITEVFPPAYHANPLKTEWRGTLFPPDSPQRKNVPAADGPRGRHYAAARAVPDAWLFRGKHHPSTLEMFDSLRLSDPKHHMLPTVEPVDHFIFYRGAGSPSRFGLYARQDFKDPNKYTLHNAEKTTVPNLFALRIQDGKSSWIQVNDLAKAKYDREIKKTVNEQSIVFPKATQSISEVAEQLRSAMNVALIKEGLTKQEAAAMIATWDDLWFTEPGTRVLAILPQSLADTMVPLEITPKPTKIDRVFVARLELISRDKEAQLMALLNQPNAQPDSLSKDAKQLVDLQLGRYSSGGMERAMELVTSDMRKRFHALDQAKPKPDQEATRVTSTK